MKRIFLPHYEMLSLINFRFCSIEHNPNDSRFGEDPSAKIDVGEDVIGRTQCKSYYMMRLVAKQRGEKTRSTEKGAVLIYQLIKTVNPYSLPENLR